MEIKALFSIHIAPAAPPPPPPLSVSNPDGSPTNPEPAVNPLPGGQVGKPFSQQLVIKGGTPPGKLSITSGALPDGLVLSKDGTISGVPTTEGDFEFEFDVVDSEE